jgi:serine protease Do
LFDFFRRFAPLPPGRGDAPEFRSQGIGSGFIISPDGYILTNAHVVAGSDRVTVRFADAQRELDAKVVGTDRRTDVAVLKVKGDKLPVLDIGRSSDLHAGDWVVAIGSPFGFSNTITAGIVSATQRTLPDESFVPFIQTDVAVNPGNSGGPLLDTHGRVVGINSMIYSQTGGYMGVSFAIPIELAMEVSAQLREHGRVTRGRIGVQIQPMTPELARSFGLDAAKGVVIASVERDGPAERAGLRPGDIVLSYDGKPITGAEDLPRLVAGTRPGTAAKMEVWREGQRSEVTVTVGEFPSEPSASSRAPDEAQPNSAGLVVRPLSRAQRRELGIDGGVLVEAAEGPAAQAGLRPGDIIVAVGRSAVEGPRQLEDLLGRLPPGSVVAVRAIRQGLALFVPLRIPE